MPRPDRFDADPALARPIPTAIAGRSTAPGAQQPVPTPAGEDGSRAAWADDPENIKLVVLARSSRARTGTEQGAAVRDDTGRTYTAATVALASVRLTALQAAVVLAAASGATALEAAAVVSGEHSSGAPPALGEEDLAAVRDLGGSGTPILLAGPDGTVRSAVTS